MAIYAHPDDAEIWSGGTIAKWNNLGGTTKILCFSNSTIRNREAKAGAVALKSSLSIIPTQPIVCPETIKAVATQLSRVNPDVVVTHCSNDSHPEHRNVFEIVSNAIIQLRITKGNPKLLLCSDTYNEICLNGIFTPNVYVDISDYMKVKLLAIEKHQTQPVEVWKKIALDQNTLLGNRLSNVKYAEGFVQIPVLGKLANLSLF